MRWFFIFVFLLNGILFGGYKDCETPAQVLEYESHLVEKYSHCDHKALCNALISRGETYILLDEFEQAMQDFLTALAILDKNQTLQNPHEKFRSHLGLSICYGYFGLENEFDASLQILTNIISKIQCSDCNTNIARNSSLSTNSQLFYQNSSLKEYSSNQFENTEDILGPDIPPRKGWCEEVVYSTSDLMKILASKAPIAGRIAFFSVIRQLEEKCIECCQSGAFWKACVAPIVHKWKEWNEKWDLLRVPPDPAWD